MNEIYDKWDGIWGRFSLLVEYQVEFSDRRTSDNLKQPNDDLHNMIKDNIKRICFMIGGDLCKVEWSTRWTAFKYACFFDVLLRTSRGKLIGPPTIISSEGVDE